MIITNRIYGIKITNLKLFMQRTVKIIFNKIIKKVMINFIFLLITIK